MLGGVPRSERAAPPGRNAVAEWVAAECIREEGARFSSRAAYAALRRYQAERMMPLPSRREFMRATASLGIRRDGEPLIGIRPRDPRVLEIATPETVAAWLESHTAAAADEPVDVRLAWASYARSVAPRMPTPRFDEALAAAGYVPEAGRLRGLAL